MQEVVVGIDFGSSGTGYAYSFNNKEDIILGNFQDQGVDVKVPTEIILDNNLNVLAFGEECKKYIKDNQLIEGELFFQRIKMSLYGNQTTIKPQNQSKEYPLKDIIAKLLGYVKKEAITKIKENRPTINENKIKWVVTVPAIWNEKQKGIMIKASEEAGLFNQFTERLKFFALEPEAASLYCAQDKSIDSNYIQPGKTFTVCDLGGGTGDIVTQTKGVKGTLSEKYHAIGGNFGSDEIDKDFFNLIINKIFGYKSFEALKKKNEELGFPWQNDELYDEWINFQNEISKKKKITEDSKDKSFFLNCQMFQDFTDDISIDSLVQKYNENCHSGWKITVKNSTRWLITFPNKIFYDLIIRQAHKITEQIREINQEVENIESILYVGGYCSNEIIVNQIKKQFKNIVHLKPSHPEIAVVKGAVLFGINPNIIIERKAKYTIGLSINKSWDETIYGQIGEKYLNDEGEYMCKNCFDLFIQIGETLSLNHKITHHLKMSAPRYCNLSFYKSYKKKPILCTEEGVEKIGEDVLDLKKDYNSLERNIIVIMKFGGTYVEAECVHEKSGINTKTNLYFDK